MSDAGLPPLQLDPGAVRSAADDVLADRAYRSAGESIVSRARGWLLDRLAEVFEALAGVDGASLVGWVVLGLTVVTLLVLVVRWGRGVRRDPSVRVDVAVDHGLDADGWEAASARLRSQGLLRAAGGARHRAFVARLVVAGVLDLDAPGRTAGEVGRLVRSARPDLAADTDDATRCLQRILYGHATPVGADLDDLERSLRAAEERLARHLERPLDQASVVT